MDLTKLQITVVTILTITLIAACGSPPIALPEEMGGMGQAGTTSPSPIATVGGAATEELSGEGVTQGGLRLQQPCQGIYRMNSYVDHEIPFEVGENPIVMFNGEEYNNCPEASDQWTNQGPYCYDGHEGIDWAMGENTPVLAATSGAVLQVQPIDTGNYGKFVRIDHGNGYVTRYAHLNAISVQVNDEVNAGDLIGYSGNTGNSSGPHLHFDVIHNGSITDPFGWRGNNSDPLINYSGEVAVCL